MPKQASLPSGEPEDQQDDDEPMVEPGQATGDRKPAAHDAQAERPAPTNAPGPGPKHLEANGAEADEDDVRPLDRAKLETPTDFNHPSTYQPQRTIWIPRDELGLAEEQARELSSEGIDVSMDNADMSAKGKVTIDGRPPGFDNE